MLIDQYLNTQEMQKRLEKVEPIYRIGDWVEDWKKNADLTEMITAYPTEEQSPHNRRKKKVYTGNDNRLIMIMKRITYCFFDKCRSRKFSPV